MKVQMLNMYGIENHNSYYRKNGFCFDFVSEVELATDLNSEEAERIINHADYYCEMYGSSSLAII